MSEMETISPGGKAALIVKVAGEQGVARFVKTFSIGRAPDNDLVIDSPSVSQQHAEVVLDEGKWWVRDLESTNGTIVGGKRIESQQVEGTLRIRLGYHGPSVVLSLEGSEESEETATSVPSESSIVRRYIEKEAPQDMGEHTAAIRRVFAQVQRKRSRKYLIALGVLAILGAASGGYAYFMHVQVQKQLAAAQEVFYTAKALELDIARLELSAEERETIRARRAVLDQQYRDFLEEIGIYSDKTAEEVRLIYRVVHRFGESEVNVPQEFVDEVLRYVERWQSSTRLTDAIGRSEQHGYGQRIADIMLEHDMPPEFFYLAVQESDLRMEAVGPETRFGIAKGMWQIIPGTAREYGLKTGPLVGVRRYDPRDERHDFERASRAAARYLRRIYTTDAQASGLLVVASYNWGQTRVIRLIRSMPQNPRQRNFWQLLTRYRGDIPRETYDYVFNIIAAAVIGENPELFGFDFRAPFERPEPAVSAQPLAPVIADAP